MPAARGSASRRIRSPVPGEPGVKTSVYRSQEEKTQRRQRILKKQMSQEKRRREKGPQGVLFLAFKSRKEGGGEKKKKKRKLQLSCQKIRMLMESWISSGRAQHKQKRARKAEATAPKGAGDPRGSRCLRKVEGQPRRAAPSICYRSPSLCPKTPAQKPGRSGQSLRKSWDKPELWEHKPLGFGHAPRRAGEKVPSVSAKPKSTWMHFRKHPLALPSSPPAVAEARGRSGCRSTRPRLRRRRASHAGKGPRGWDGARGSNGCSPPSLPPNRSRPTPEKVPNQGSSQARAPSRNLFANPWGLGVSFPLLAAGESCHETGETLPQQRFSDVFTGGETEAGEAPCARGGW